MALSPQTGDRKYADTKLPVEAGKLPCTHDDREELRRRALAIGLAATLFASRLSEAAAAPAWFSPSSTSKAAHLPSRISMIASTSSPSESRW